MSNSPSQSTGLSVQPRIVLGFPEEPWAKEVVAAFKRAGYLPHLTPSPEVTSLALSFREPAAIFVDALFLRTAGMQILETYRMNAPGTPLIVTTEAEDTDLRLRALVQGAEDCLVRPFAPQEAVLRLRRVLDGKQRVRALAMERAESASRGDRLRDEMESLLGARRRQAELLQRAIDFHQRLVPQHEPGEIRSRFLRNLHLQIGVDRLAYLALPHDQGTWMVTRATWGLPRRLGDRLRLPARGELAQLLEATGTPLLLSRLESLPGLRTELGILSAGGFTSVVPLLQHGRLVGLVVLGETRQGGAPDDESLRLAHFLTSALVPALAAQVERDRDQHLTVKTLEALVGRLEGGDRYLQGHSLRVAEIAEDLGSRLGLSSEELTVLNLGALLHDVGRFELDHGIWSKSDPLTREDWELIRRHPIDGARVLGEASWPQGVLDVVRHHHERWDGTGYPDGLAGEAIPSGARILAVADGLDALTSPRPHRPALSVEDGLRELHDEAGSRYDPRMVEVLLRNRPAGVAL